MAFSKTNKLPPKARKFFHAFLVAPTLWKKEVRSLHSNDWTRLHVFIRHCAQYNVSITDNELKELLKEQKFSISLIEEISIIYKHGRKILKI